MLRSARVGFAAVLFALGATEAPAGTAPLLDEELPTGRYRAWLDSPGGELPFGLELERGPEGDHARLINGPESIPVPGVRVEGRHLVLDIEHYDSRIEAELQDDGLRLEGSWRKRSAGTDEQGRPKFSGLAFHAIHGARHRFGRPPGPPVRSMLSSSPARFAVQFASSDEPAVLELQDRGGELVGTFLTTTGDYRYLAGQWESDGFRLSCFDGAHAFLFHARRAEGEALSFEGDFWSRDSWHERWTARLDPEARLPDAFALTRVDESVDLGALSYPDLEGRPRRLDDPAFAGEARLIYVFGSWCPNCHDCTEYLVELHRRYAPRGLRIVGLAFELSEDFERDARVVRSYRERHGVPWPLLLAGPSDKGRASEAFPALDRIRSYPTTIFLDSEDRVRAVHQGFSGPATGEAHQELRAEFERRIEGMLATGEGRDPAADR